VAKRSLLWCSGHLMVFVIRALKTEKCTQL
jgi:hypothetical protein